MLFSVVMTLCVATIQCPTFDSRTLEIRMRPVLASKGVHLIRVGYRTSCYVLGVFYEAYLSLTVSQSTVRWTGVSDKERCVMLHSVGRRIKQRRTDFWSGNWSLNEDICRIPQDLWRGYVVQMASTRKRKTWKLAAKATEETV